MGALINPLTREFGWSRAQVTGASLALTTGMLVMGTVVGGMADRFGARRVALISQVILAGVLCGLTLITSNVWSLYAAYFALGSLAAGTLPIIWCRAVTGWFVRSRGIALGLSLLGTGVVGMPLELLFFRERERTVLPLTGVTGTPATNMYQSHTFREAITCGQFWRMACAFLMVAVVIGAINVNALPLLTDRGIAGCLLHAGCTGVCLFGPGIGRHEFGVVRAGHRHGGLRGGRRT